MKQLLEKYSELNKARAAFFETHKDVFSTLQEIDQSIGAVQNEIKEAAKQTKEDVTHAGVVVKVTRAWNKWYEWKELSTKSRKLLESLNAVTHDVDKKVFEQLVHDEKISKAERAAAFQERELSPRISVNIEEAKV